MAAERVKFTFPPDLVNTPVIYNMGKEFGVVTNIRRANLSHDRGWVILEVVGTPEAVEKSLAWAKEQGVRIEPASPSRPAPSKHERGTVRRVQRGTSAMSVRVRIPTPLRSATDGAAELSSDAPTVVSLIEELEVRYPAIRGRLRDETGALRRFVNLYVNGEDVRFLTGLETTLKSGDELSIIPAVAGG